jgi:hypothetical protein
MSLTLRRFVFLLSLACLTASASACATSLNLGAAQIHEAPPEGVAQCTFLGTVVGHVGPFHPSALDDAKADALNHAAEVGATQVVWASISAGYGATAMAQAYRCSRDRAVTL